MSRRAFRWAMLLPLGLALHAGAFDRSDYQTITNRLLLYERPPYAIAASRKMVEPDTKPGTTELTVYYVSTNWYDPLFRIPFGYPADIEQTPAGVSFRHGDAQLTLTADGIRYVIDRTFAQTNAGGPLFRVLPDTIRFDDATAFRRREGKLTCLNLQPRTLAPLQGSPWLPTAESVFAQSAAFEPDTVIRTLEGLWTCWRFDLKTEGIASLLDPQGAALMIGGGGTLMFYNAASRVAAGAKASVTMSFRAQPDAAFPLPVAPATRPAMVDTHVHIATSADLRDSILMARRHGFQYWTLAILYDERPPYGRFFRGNDDLFAAMRRAPDVFLGFGLLQLEANGYPGFPRPGPDRPDHIQRLWEQGCVGLKTLVKFSKHQVRVDDPAYDPLWARAAELRMPIVFHTEEEGTGSSHTRVAAVARRFPGSPMILAHLADGQIDTTVRELRATPTLFIQHMHLERKDATGQTALARLVAEGLAERILFGSDVTVDHAPLLAERDRFVAKLKDLNVPEATVERILSATARSLVDRVAPRPNAGHAAVR